MQTMQMGENCKVVTRFNGKYDGTLQLINASIHVNGEYNDTKRSYDLWKLFWMKK